MVIGHDLELGVTEHVVDLGRQFERLGRGVHLRVDQLLTVAVLHTDRSSIHSGFDTDLELTLTQDGGVASGDGALGILVSIFAGQFRQDDLLDLVLYHVLVLTKTHTALEGFKLGDEFLGSLLFHDCGQRPAHALLLVLFEELARRGEEDHEVVEPVLFLADQR